MHDKSRELIRVGGVAVWRGLQETDPPAWQRMLQTALRQNQQPECLCWGSEKPMPLSIARHGKSLIIRRMPMSGPNHHALCPSHGGKDASRAGSRTSSAAVQKPDSGVVDIKLDVPLSTFTGAALNAPKGRQNGSAASTDRQDMTLLGLMHLIWERAGLNRYSETTNRQKRISHVYAKVIEELGEITIDGAPATDRLFVPNLQFTEDAMEQKVLDLNEQYESLLDSASANEKPVMLIMAEVRRCTISKFSFGLLLKGMPNICPIWASRVAMDRISRSFPELVTKLLSGNMDKDSRIWCLAGVQMSSKGSFNLVYGSLMELAVKYIPVDSCHELTLVSALVRQGRTFIKPLRYTREELVSPDFILLDTLPPVAMEVSGLGTPEYLYDKRKKLQILRDQKQRLWTWDAHKKDPMPAFPIDRN